MYPEEFRAIIKHRLHRAREQANLTLEQVAEALEVSVRYYQRLEGVSKTRFNPTLETLIQLATLFDVPLEQLLKIPEPLELEELPSDRARGRPRR